MHETRPDLFRRIFDHSRHAMAIVDDDGTVHDVNRAVVELLGLPRSSLLGRDRRTTLEPLAIAEVDAQHQALRAGHGWVGAYRLGRELAIVDVCAEPDLTRGRHLVLYAVQDGGDRPPDAHGPRRVRAVADAERAAGLTQRELEIVGELALGATSAQIAQRLVLSEHTVRTHVRNAMERTDAHTRAHLVVIAMRAGLVGDALRPQP